MNCHGCKYLAKVKAGSQWAYFMCTAEKPAQIIERVQITTMLQLGNMVAV